MYDAAIQKIQEHNSNPANTWKMALNRFSVMTKPEFTKFFGYAKNTHTLTREINQTDKKPTPPTEWDWREREPKVVTSVKNQGGCGASHVLILLPS